VARRQAAAVLHARSRLVIAVPGSPTMLFAKRTRTINRLLIVEDEPLIAFDNEHFLQEKGFDVVATVDTVADALAVIGTQTIDLVLADVNLSDGNGIDVARAAHAKGIPVLFVTGACPVEARAWAIGCLAKPYPPRDLIDALDAVDATIAGKPPRRSPRGLSLYA
jgi:DNA-binding response OmpR family regulator